jgi:hypothetical protein
MIARLLRRRWKVARAERVSALVSVLQRTPDRYRSPGDLGSATGLGASVLPLLADLSRQRHVEHVWTDEAGVLTLAYRLSASGRALPGRADVPGEVVQD